MERNPYKPRLSELILVFLFVFPALSPLAAQVGPPNNPGEYEEQYQKRIKKEYLYGVYIPKDLADAFVQLNKLTDADSRQQFKGMNEVDAGRKLHFSLGRWMIHNWGFYDGSRMSHYLKGLGLSHPDDMAFFITICYHRYLNKRGLEVKLLLEAIKNRRMKRFLEEKREGEVLHKETRTRKEE